MQKKRCLISCSAYIIHPLLIHVLHFGKTNSYKLLFLFKSLLYFYHKKLLNLILLRGPLGSRRKYVNKVKPDAMGKIEFAHE